jgi:outer membrane protein
MPLQYRFNGRDRVSPLVGAGINCTTFFSEDAGGAAAGADLKLEDCCGPAAHAGADFVPGQGGAGTFAGSAP